MAFKEKFLTEKRKLESLLGEDVYIALCECNAIIAGGTLTSIFSGKEVNDLDIYFKTPEQALEFARMMDDSSETIFFHNTDRSILIKDFSINKDNGGQDVQMIVYKFFPTVDDIFKAFDFTVNMAAAEFTLVDEECSFFFHFHEDFFNHLAQRRLIFNTGTDYPLVSDIRVGKYEDKGYVISKKEKFKILLSVNKKKIDSWEILKDELGSMYGLNKNELFDEKIEFSLESAIEQLDDINWIETIYKLNHPTLHVVEKVIAKNGNIKVDSLEGRYFKVVLKTETKGVYYSLWNRDYKYVLGQEACENHHGIYFAEGFRGLENSCYWQEERMDNSGRVIIEIKLDENATIVDDCNATSVRAVGGYTVVGEYSYQDWQNLKKNVDKTICASGGFISNTISVPIIDLSFPCAAIPQLSLNGGR